MSKYNRKRNRRQLDPFHPVAIAALIEQQVSFFDTVILFSRRKLGGKVLRELQARCEGKNHFDPNPHPEQPRLVCKIVLQQPKAEAYEYLAQFPDWVFVVSEVGIADDLIVKNERDAGLVKKFYLLHGVHLWRPDYELGYTDGTFYSMGFRKERFPNQIAIYNDKPSKLIGKPCCHIEKRPNNSRAVKRAGIKNVRDLIDFDFTEFWSKNLQLRGINESMLGRLSQKPRGRGRRRKARRIDPFVGYRMMAVAAMSKTTNGAIEARPFGSVEVVARRWKKKLGGAAFNRCLIRIDNTPFLP